METYTVLVQPGQCLQAALDALPKDSAVPARVCLGAGVWHEKIELLRPNTTLEGAESGETVITWQDGATDPWPDIGHKGTFRTATLRTDGAHITLRRLTVVNAAAPREKAGQAVALYADGDFFTCEDCTLLSYQDTLFTAPLPPKEVQKNGFVGPKQYAPRTFQRHVYRRCHIRGDVDFVFGGAAAWFEDCDLVTEDGRANRDQPTRLYATAASTPEGQTFGYVFKDCRFTTTNCPDASVYLGRPWRSFAKTVLLHCELGPHILPEGWHDWGKADFPASGFYAEYDCYGPGSQGERASFAHRLTEAEAAQYTLERFLACEK